MACPCEGLQGEELVRCLAPPPGDYEVHIPVSRDKAVIANNSIGVGLRTIILDETLPFMNTFTRPLGLERALALAGVGLEEFLCRVVEALERAASSGSITSRRRLGECRELVERVREGCSG
ncbi:MAG: class I SAM-dependent methyltransferase [Desulfurococcales archaeon]|nr:class I SAM-dependent methyltransferase [Desulfurococcales archaeon]